MTTPCPYCPICGCYITESNQMGVAVCYSSWHYNPVTIRNPRMKGRGRKAKHSRNKPWRRWYQ